LKISIEDEKKKKKDCVIIRGQLVGKKSHVQEKKLEGKRKKQGIVPSYRGLWETGESGLGKGLKEGRISSERRYGGEVS